jgi:fumarate hydratase class II
VVWQTGSGTQTNMNANEVIANRANQLLGHPLGSRDPIHPNDHVNRGQSSNDSFPTVMHLAAVQAVQHRLKPALEVLVASLAARAEAWADVVKVGRTHLMDAVPVTLGGEFATWANQLRHGLARLDAAMPRLLLLPQGGTAAGTGLNRHPDFDRVFCEVVAMRSGLAFRPNPDKSEGMAAHDALLELHGMLNVLAASLTKLANDVRLLGSGPRSGLAELVIPEDGLSSSIMPGKTNPTQSEALAMVCAQVMGNQVTVGIACAHGHLELNTYKPVIIHAVLQSIALLADAGESFARHMVDQLEPNLPRIGENLAKSLMLATALNPHIGYDRAVQVAKLGPARGPDPARGGAAPGRLHRRGVRRLGPPGGDAAPAMNPHLVKRSLRLAGHPTSVALEAEFWAVLEAAALQRGVSLAVLVAEQDAARGTQPLASRLRVAALALRS